jgi:hypothetical protein
VCTENSILAPRIHGELLKLGFEVAQSRVARYMVKRCGPPSQGWHMAIYECFPPSEGAPALPKNQTPPLTRFLLVILMIVKEASYLSLQRRCLLQIPDCTGAVEELFVGTVFQRISTAAPRHFKICSSSSTRAVRLS